jgi:hypothetical protein
LNSPTLLWTTTGGGSFSPSDTSLNAVYTPATTDWDLDSVVLTLTATGGCINVSDYLVIDFTPFVIPNVFTPYPSSPGFNDYFVIDHLPAGTFLKIWDRWGKVVFTSDYYLNNWDAYGLKADVYYYVLETEEKSYKGWVQVLRD